MFEPFFRLEKSRSRETGGTGLGLSITQQIVSDHGAHIDYESEPGKGTRFFVEFPLHSVSKEKG